MYLVSAFLLGVTSGLRALLGLAMVSWAARLGYVHLEHTWLAFLGYAFTPYVLSLMAIGELVNDKLSKTPSRLIPPQFITRVVTGSLCGVSLGLATGHLLLGFVAGLVGSIAGTFGGAKARGLGRRFWVVICPQRCLKTQLQSVSPYLLNRSRNSWFRNHSTRSPGGKFVQTTSTSAVLESNFITGIILPDSSLIRETTELVRDTETSLLFNHSSRLFCFAYLAGKERGLKFDAELLYRTIQGGHHSSLL